jgi:hypothetical protein
MSLDIFQFWLSFPLSTPVKPSKRRFESHLGSILPRTRLIGMSAGGMWDVDQIVIDSTLNLVSCEHVAFVLEDKI